ncbi:MAG: TOPRIM nucleotidyl transferase/hydrolase domain-containing protein, partial [Geminicoccaceae bacterium]
KRLPGHDTLRLILAKRSILVEGPSDELVVQAAFKKKHGKMPLEAGVDVISVNSLTGCGNSGRFRRVLPRVLVCSGDRVGLPGRRPVIQALAGPMPGLEHHAASSLGRRIRL